jgi:hypothetical protein
MSQIWDYIIDIPLLKHIQLKLTKVATQLRCSRPFGNVLQRPAMPNHIYLSLKSIVLIFSSSCPSRENVPQQSLYAI